MGGFLGKDRVWRCSARGWGDCYFLSSISALSEYPYLIREKFRTVDYNELGYYEVIWYIDGEWQIIFVDDYFPYAPQNRNFAFAAPNGNELWAILLEKVWAKSNGGYSNIIAGIVSEPVTAWTGFPTKYIHHSSIDVDDLFETIEKADKEGTIMSSASKQDEEQLGKGIVCGHAYTLIGAKSWDAKRLYLLKLRNPWGSGEWKGDWSDTSHKWTEETKKYFGYTNADDGIFWIDIDNYVANFDSSYICYLLYGSEIKNYYFEYEKYLRSPVVFNIQILEKAKTSVNIQFKNWRFNRDIHDVVHPFIVVICKYEEDRKVTKLFSDYSLNKDIEIIQDWEPGYYVCWLYCNYEYVKNDPNFRYSLSIASVKHFKCEFNGWDTDFQLLNYWILENYRFNNAGILASSKDYLITGDKEVQKQGGLFNILVYNKQDCWIELSISIKQSNVTLFPPYKNLSSFKVKIPPKHSAAVFGFLQGFGSSSFGYSSSTRINSRDKKQEPFEKFSHFWIFDFQNNRSNDNENCWRTKQYKYVVQERLNELPKFTSTFIGKDILKIATMNKEKVTKESLEKEFPKEFQILNNSFSSPSPNASNLYWEKISNEEGLFLGEINKDSGEIMGKGIFIWTKTKVKYIGNWNKNKMHGSGILYTNEWTKIYEGFFENGVKSNMGTFYISANEYYVGWFKNDKMNGKGIYYFPNGDTWEGPFENDMKHGVGVMTFHSSSVKYLVKYEKDNFWGKTKIEKEEENQIKDASDKDKKESDSNYNGNNQNNKADKDKNNGSFLNKFNEFKKYLINHFEKKSQEWYEKKSVIVSNVIIEKIENEILETPEEKRHKEYIMKWEQFKKDEPFMLEQFQELYANEEEKLDLIIIDKKDDSRYWGGIKEDNGEILKHGRGAWFDGRSYYIGYFKNDKPCGYFRKYGEDKKILFSGTLDENYNIVGLGKVYFPNGDCYDGTFQNGELHGQGIYIFSSKDSWSGTFVNNKFHGSGKYFYANGLITETISYDHNHVISRAQLQREDYSDPNNEAFFENIKSKYPGVIERLLKWLPVRKEKNLKWVCWTFQNGQIYVGQVSSDNKYNGRGCMIFVGQSIAYYIGYFRNSSFNGFGRFYYKDWSVQFEGRFLQNAKTGFGKYYFDDKSVYIGYYNKNQKEGLGVYIYGNGARFEGRFWKGEQHDKGTFIESDFNSIQESEYKEGNLVSQGDKIICTKRKYESDIIQKQNAKLGILYPKYTKLFQALPRVKDNYVLSRVAKQDFDGLYIGEVNTIGFKHGRGVLRNSRGTGYFVGYFEFNQKEGQGTIYYDDNKPKYIGNFHNNWPYGVGKYFYPKGEVIEGDFNEVGEGKGVYTFQDGSKWNGTFYAWTLHGSGEYFDSNGNSLGIKRYRYNTLVS